MAKLKGSEIKSIRLGLEIAVAKRKKLFDKRETSKERDAKRQMDREE